MKRLATALSALTLLLVAAPAGATTQWDDSCRPSFFPEVGISRLRQRITDLDYRGPRCLKMCKSEYAGCKKVNAAFRKCNVAAAKSFFKTQSLECQLLGGDRRTCDGDAKELLKSALANFKFLLEDTKKNFCDTQFEFCKSDCAAP